MSRTQRAVSAVTLCAVLAGLAGPGWAQVNDTAADRAIERAQNYLWSQWNEQTCWDDATPTPPENDRKPTMYGGQTAIAAYALLAAGHSPQEPRMARTLDWLARLDTQATYVLAVRANVWALAGQQYRRNLQEDTRTLIRSVNQTEALGSYVYFAAGRDPRGVSPFSPFDNSNSQFGVLGVWAGWREGIEVPRRYWEIVRDHWVDCQWDSGGWGYTSPGFQRDKAPMTAGGIATLFICIDALYADEFVGCRGEFDYEPLEEALDWMDRNFAIWPIPNARGTYHENDYAYYLYALERAGLACGYKYFGGHDWYAEGLAFALDRQGDSGAWDGRVSPTALCLLFLARGQRPIMFNHLEHEGDWQNRPRALANLTHWMSRTFEREINWQIINLSTPVEDWHDSPIVYISGSEPAGFSDEHIDKLREFVWQGGTLLSVEECAGSGFTVAMREAYARMFPQYELVELDRQHPLYSVHFPVRRPYRVYAISNGARILAFHIQQDVVRSWQLNAGQTQRLDFELASNLYLYVTDLGIARNRGTSMWPEPTRQGSRTIRLARLSHSGIYDPEPLAWQRFARMLAHEQDVRLEVSEPMAIAELDAETHPVAHLTGTTGFNLSGEEIAALQAYCRAGGRLIVDACGGNENFIESFEQVAPRIFEGDQTLRPLASTSEVYRLDGLELNEVDYRRAAGAGGNQPRLRALMLDDELVGLWSVEDLTAGLVGYQQFGLAGYAPGLRAEDDSAYRVMRNCVLWAAGE